MRVYGPTIKGSLAVEDAVEAEVKIPGALLLESYGMAYSSQGIHHL